MSQLTPDGTVPPTLSEAQWAALPEDEPGELVDGRLVEEEMPDLTHEAVVSWLIGGLRTWLVPQGGFVFGSEAKFIVGPRRGRKPDVTAYFPGGPSLPRRGAVRMPPDIAVEVVSLEARDVRPSPSMAPVSAADIWPLSASAPVGFANAAPLTIALSMPSSSFMRDSLGGTMAVCSVSRLTISAASASSRR
jgi:hypothetical protein